MALDPMEQFFVTGSADGDIKVWKLTLSFKYTPDTSKINFKRNNPNSLHC